MKIAVYQQSPFNLTAWAILPRQMGKDIRIQMFGLIETYCRRLKAIIAAKIGSKYWPGGWIQNVCTIIKWLASVYMVTALLIIVGGFSWFSFKHCKHDESLPQTHSIKWAVIISLHIMNIQIWLVTKKTDSCDRIWRGSWKFCQLVALFSLWQLSFFYPLLFFMSSPQHSLCFTALKHHSLPFFCFIHLSASTLCTRIY